MIKKRKEMYAYIRQDMKRNLMCGGKILDKNSFKSTALLHR